MTAMTITKKAGNVQNDNKEAGNVRQHRRRETYKKKSTTIMRKIKSSEKLRNVEPAFSAETPIEVDSNCAMWSTPREKHTGRLRHPASFVPVEPDSASMAKKGKKMRRKRMAPRIATGTHEKTKS